MTAAFGLAQPLEDLRSARWSPAVRVAFRFCSLYFGLFCLLTQVVVSFFEILPDDIPDPGTLWPFRQIVSWTSVHAFGGEAPLSFAGNSASGDDMFAWVTHFCLLVSAVLGTVVWSLLARGRVNYTGLHRWFRVFIRFSLAGQMLQYGFAKVFPLQMPFVLAKLVQPFGSFSPMGVLWSFIGASQPYEIFAGCAEVLGGILLIFPRTTTLGALVCMADMTQVFILNMTYDVPVKIFSFHLLLLSVFLFAPEARRMAAFLWGDRGVGPSAQTELFRVPRANRIALSAQIVFGVWIIGLSAHFGFTVWKTYGSGRIPPPFYGIWNVDEILIDGHVQPPLLTDSGRWRRLIVDFPQMLHVQRMDDSFAQYGAGIDMKDKTIKLSKGHDPKWRATLAFDRQAGDRMSLDGEMDHRRVHMQLHLVNLNRFLLVNRGFHWIQETNFNR